MLQQEILDSLIVDLYNLKAIVIQEIKENQSRKTPLIINNKSLINNSMFLGVYVDWIYSLKLDWHNTVTCGVPFSGLPIIAALYQTYHVPFVMIGKNISNSQDDDNVSEKPFAEGQTCVIIDSIKPLKEDISRVKEQLYNIALQPKYLIYCIDDDLTSIEAEICNLRTYTMFTLSKIIKILLSQCRLTHRDVSILKDFLLKKDFS